jgi:hypothetical protein
MTFDVFLSHFDATPTSPGQWTARCPAHADRSPSLSIALGAEDRRLLYCHGGCPVEAVLAAAGLTPGDLWATPRLRAVEAPGRAVPPRTPDDPVEARARRLERRYGPWKPLWADAGLSGAERQLAEAARRVADGLADPEGEQAWLLRALAASLDTQAEQADAQQDAQLRAMRHAPRKRVDP